LLQRTAERLGGNSKPELRIDPFRIALAVWLIFPELAAFAFRAEAT
jgi:hypothetical protein